MPLEIVTVPALQDNYDYLVHDPASGATAVVDVADLAPVLAALAERGWTLSEIWLTHHHDDHIQGAEPLRAATGAKLVGAANDAHRLPPLDVTVAEGDMFSFGGDTVHVFDVSGHTVGHIAYYIAGAEAAFTADSLMALGCGRLFEGSAEQMWASLSKLAQLPDTTKIYSGHEYTASNAKFAASIDPDNAALTSRIAQIKKARERGEPTVPSGLAEEKATNPFLRAGLDEMKQAIGMPDATDVDVFAEIRRRKDSF